MFDLLYKLRPNIKIHACYSLLSLVRPKDFIFYKLKDCQLSYLCTLKVGHNFSVQNGDIYSLEKRCLNEIYHRNFGTKHRNFSFPKIAGVDNLCKI